MMLRREGGGRRRGRGWVCVWRLAGRAAAESARTRLDGHTLVVTLQNGLGNLETIAEVLGGERTLLGMTYVGAALLGPGHARLTAAGKTFVGEPNGTRTDRVEHLAQS